MSKIPYKSLGDLSLVCFFHQETRHDTGTRGQIMSTVGNDRLIEGTRHIVSKQLGDLKEQLQRKVAFWRRLSHLLLLLILAAAFVIYFLLHKLNEAMSMLH